MRGEERVIAITGLIVLLIGLAKLIAGYMYNVPALIADGYHGLADAVIDLAGLAIIYASRRGSMSEARAKYLFSFIISEFLIALGVLIAFEKFEAEPIRSPIPLIVSILAASVLFGASKRREIEGERLNSPVLKAEAAHGYSDVISTFGAILGSLYVYLGMHLNVIGTLLVVATMIYMGFRLGLESVQFLVEYIPKDLRRIIESNLPPGAVLRDVHLEQVGEKKVVYVIIEPASRSEVEVLEAEKRIRNALKDYEVHLVTTTRPRKKAIAVDENMKPTKFGEAYGFIIIDGRSKGFVENPYRDEKKHRGVKAMRMLIDMGVREVYAEDFGDAVRSVFKGQVEMKKASLLDLAEGEYKLDFECKGDSEGDHSKDDEGKAPEE